MGREWGLRGYTEVKVLGSGGFGEVVLARHDGSGTPVAVKYLRPALLADAEFAALFRAEAAVLASLDDPNVVRLYEYAESPGCRPDDQSDASYQAAATPDDQATTDKKAFAASWTAIADEYRLPLYQYNQI